MLLAMACPRYADGARDHRGTAAIRRYLLCAPPRCGEEKTQILRGGDRPALGAGRFLVLARGHAAETNLVWKHTVLVRTGETVDILLELTNPGRWMAHCHIAEHHESGMMFSFTVDPSG